MMILTKLDNIFVVWSAKAPKSYRRVLLRWNNFYDTGFYKHNRGVVVRLMKAEFEAGW